MTDKSPNISLYLDGDIAIKLGNKGISGATPTLQIQMHDASHPATLFFPGYSASTYAFGLLPALQGGLVDLFDIDKNARISIPSGDEEPGRLFMKAGARNRWFDLTFDWREDVWTHLLTPGHKYHIRWRDDGVFLWAFRGNDRQVSPEHLPVRLLPRPIKLHVLDSAATPLQLSISLSPTADTCHLIGKPRFGLKLQVVSHDEDNITICLNNTPLRKLHSMQEIAYIVDEQGEEVEWPYAIGCFECTKSFPSDDMFEEVKPNVLFEKTFWLDKFDNKTSNGGELDELQSGHSYTGRVSKNLLRTFSKWRRGTKEELLAGDENQKEERWSGSSEKILLDVSPLFKFKAV